MDGNISFAHLRIKELEGRIHARRQLAEQAPERTWHLDYVRAYEAEMQRLRNALQGREPTMPGGDSPTARQLAH